MNLGRWFGIKIRVKKGAIFSSAILWVTFAFALRYLGQLSWDQALSIGLMVTIVHWLSDLAHQLGHAAVAHATGYPMSLLVFNWFLIASAYPKDEPRIPARIHVRRALGGMPVSLTLGLVSLIAYLLLEDRSAWLRLLLLAAAMLNIVVFGLGAMLPLGFTDGSTLLVWLPRMWQQRLDR